MEGHAACSPDLERVPEALVRGVLAVQRCRGDPDSVLGGTQHVRLLFRRDPQFSNRSRILYGDPVF